MKNRRDTIYAQEPLASKPLAPEALALREFDELYEEDEELFAWVDRLLEEDTPKPQTPALCRQSFPPAAQPLTTKSQARSTAPSSITERQMRALSRKHLLLMLRDLEQELLQVTR